MKSNFYRILLAIGVISITLNGCSMKPQYVYMIQGRGTGSSGFSYFTNKFEVKGSCVYTEEGNVICGDYQIIKLKDE